MSRAADILIVDDHSSQGKTMAAILRLKGHRVTAVSGGPEAIDEVRKRGFDIIFLDIKMPMMNGVETQRRIKEIRPETVVVMMTAFAVEDLVQEALQDGAFGIVYKPLDIAEVVGLVDEALELKRGVLALIVDDSKGIRKVFKTVLGRKGHQVTTVRDGETAVALAAEKRHDIIFIDMKLPLMNGLETYQAIRELDQNAAIVMMTGYRMSMDDLVTEALRADARACIYKPLDMQEVLEIVDEIGRSKEARRAE